MKRKFSSRDLRDLIVALDYGTFVASVILYHLNIQAEFNEYHLLAIVSGFVFVGLFIFQFFNKTFLQTEQDYTYFAEALAITASLFIMALFTIVNLNLLIIAIEAVLIIFISLVFAIQGDSEFFYYLGLNSGYNLILFCTYMCAWQEMGCSIFIIVPVLQITIGLIAHFAKRYFLKKQSESKWNYGQYVMYGLCVELMIAMQASCGIAAQGLRSILPIPKK